MGIVRFLSKTIMDFLVEILQVRNKNVLGDEQNI